ncbi:hypothetical protein DL95DRAFT_381215 [Leptodontidium sp. 2 PMI_412]|nr:hypothetical protein DL95DRAFT_381215 [Leptodontidium sp. 2 PMI_412]
MASKTTLALAIALPLALLCLGSVALLFRYRDQRNKAFISRFELEEAQKQLSAFPAANNPNPLVFSRDELISAYWGFSVALDHYVYKWALPDEPPIPGKHSAARIEALLFPELPHLMTIDEGTDRRLFPNPHHYTADDICSALGDRKTRNNMLVHILMSIILKDVSLEGPPTLSLLPFEWKDIRDLNKLYHAIRTLKLDGRVIDHIARFWMYNSKPNSDTVTRRQELGTLARSLFEPYFLPDADKLTHDIEFAKVLDEAVEFGKRVTGCAEDHIELRWGERDDVEWIVTMPAMYAVEYVNKDKSYDQLLDRGTALERSEEEERHEARRFYLMLHLMGYTEEV